MALSYHHSNWPASLPLESDMSILDPQLLSEFLYPESSNSLFHDYSNGVSVTTPSDNLNFLETDQFLLDHEFEPFHYPKRQKGCDYYQQQLQDSQFQPVFYNGVVQDCSFTIPQFPDFPTAPPSFNCDQSLKKEPPSSSGSLSAQSISARQRRRKITEKTQELGKLVPGGQKMNTAEMLQAAYKYIKFLQAQVAVLGFMDSCDHHQEEKDKEGSETSDRELQGLLESPLIQEKLYSAEKCLSTQKFVQELELD